MLAIMRVCFAVYRHNGAQVICTFLYVYACINICIYIYIYM